MISLIEAFEFESENFDRRKPWVLFCGSVLLVLGLGASICLVVPGLTLKVSNLIGVHGSVGRIVLAIGFYVLTVFGVLLIIQHLPDRLYRRGSLGIRMFAPFGLAVMQILLFLANAVIAFAIVGWQDKGDSLDVDGVVVVLFTLAATTVLGFLGVASWIQSGAMSIAKEFKGRNRAVLLGSASLVPPLLVPVLLGGEDGSVWPGAAVTSVVAWIGYLAAMRRWIDTNFRELVVWLLSIRNSALDCYISCNCKHDQPHYVYQLSCFQAWMLKGPGALQGRVYSSGLFALCQIADARQRGIENVANIVQGERRRKLANDIAVTPSRDFAGGIAILFDALLRSADSTFSRGIEEKKRSKNEKKLIRKRGLIDSHLRRLADVGILSRGTSSAKTLSSR